MAVLATALSAGCSQGPTRSDDAPISIDSGHVPDVVSTEAEAGHADAAMDGTTTLDEALTADTEALESGTEAGGDSLRLSSPASVASLTSFLTLGRVDLGSSSEVQSFRLINVGKQTSGAISVSCDSRDFAIQTGDPDDCASTTLAKNATCLVRVVFTPSVHGYRSGTITFSSADGSIGTVSVSGFGGTACSSGTHDGGDGTCVALFTCASGYHNGGSGTCVVNVACPPTPTAPTQSSDDAGKCVPIAGMEWIQRATLQRWTGVATSADGTKLVASALRSYLYTSTDAGATWTARATLQDWVAVVSSADGNKLAAVAGDGQLVTSDDSGLTWITREARGSDRLASSADGTKLVMTTAANAIMVSSDSGATWSQSPLPYAGGWASAVAYSADGSILAVGQSLTYKMGTVYVSTDSGGSWTELASSATSPTSMAFSADGTKLLVGGVESFLIQADVPHATSVINGMTADWSCVASSADGSKRLAGTDGGYLWRSQDSFTSWTSTASAQYWSSVASSADGTRLVATSSGSPDGTGYGGGGYIYTSNGPVP